jgi:TolA-binding protein
VTRGAGRRWFLFLVASAMFALRPASAQQIAMVGPKSASAGTISDSDLRAVAASMDEGRTALKHNNLGSAIQLFAKVVKYPENQYSAEAQELLGLAQQKAGRFGEARAAYEDYLRRYPSGEQSERVRQRLAGVLTTNDQSGAPPKVGRRPGALSGLRRHFTSATTASAQ